MTEQTREEHIEWCIKRALEYVERGDLVHAWASMASDLNKHPQTRNHSGIKLGFVLQINGHLSTAHEMREFIRGFR